MYKALYLAGVLHTLSHFIPNIFISCVKKLNLRKAVSVIHTVRSCNSLPSKYMIGLQLLGLFLVKWDHLIIFRQCIMRFNWCQMILQSSFPFVTTIAKFQILSLSLRMTWCNKHPKREKYSWNFGSYLLPFHILAILSKTETK